MKKKLINNTPFRCTLCKKALRNKNKTGMCSGCQSTFNNRKKIKKMTKKRMLQLQKREMNKQDKEWKEAVRKRDAYTCTICGNSKLVHTHHIIPRQDKKNRWNVYNGICLCPLHHKFSNICSPHKNPLMFFMWMRTNRMWQLNKLGWFENEN